MATKAVKAKSEETKKTTTKAVKNTDEIKQEKAVAIRENNANEEEKPITSAEEPISERDKEIEGLKAQIEQLKQLVASQTQVQPKQIVVSADNSERVWFLWMADVADDNVTLIGEHGEYGRIVGKTGTFYVPKNDLSRVLDTATRYYLEQRWMIVMSGLTDEEREALGVNYKDGELLDKNAFAKIAELGSELLEIFPELCDSHKDMVASRLHEAYESGKKIDRQQVIELNKIYPNAALVDIIEQMNAKELG